MGWLKNVFGSSEQPNITCPSCGESIPIEQLGRTGACQACHCLPVPLNSLKCIGVLVVTNRNNQEEIEWWNKKGGLSAFLLANKKLGEVILQPSAKSIGYKCGVVVTKNEIAGGTKVNQWMEDALKTVEAGERDSIIFQHGSTITRVPSGDSVKCILVNVIVFSFDLLRQPDHKPPIYVVTLNSPVVPF